MAYIRTRKPSVLPNALSITVPVSLLLLLLAVAVFLDRRSRAESRFSHISEAIEPSAVSKIDTWPVPSSPEPVNRFVKFKKGPSKNAIAASPKPTESDPPLIPAPGTISAAESKPPPEEKTLGSKPVAAGPKKYEKVSLAMKGGPNARYLTTQMHGFTLHISRMCIEMNEKQDGQPLGFISEELKTITTIMPNKSLDFLTTVPIWIEWDHVIPATDAVAVYFGDVGEYRLWKEGIDPQKNNAICILSLKNAHEMASSGKRRELTCLHELSHAVHSRVAGRNNPMIENAYSQATSRGLHEDNYASTNSAEYFAEISCAYLHALDYYPFNSEDLKDYDPVGYEMASKVWGTSEWRESQIKGKHVGK